MAGFPEFFDLPVYRLPREQYNEELPATLTSRWRLREDLTATLNSCGWFETKREKSLEDLGSTRRSLDLYAFTLLIRKFEVSISRRM